MATRRFMCVVRISLLMFVLSSPKLNKFVLVESVDKQSNVVYACLAVTSTGI